MTCWCCFLRCQNWKCQAVRGRRQVRQQKVISQETMASKNNNDEKQQRADRLSQALRDNLFKRKAQARKRSSASSDKDKPIAPQKDNS